MSRCVACNCILTSREMTIKGINSGRYLDLCKSCISETDIEYDENSSVSDSDAPLEFEEKEDEI